MKIAVLIAIAGLVLIAIKWAFLHGRRLPRHWVRHMRIRIRLRLHPGKGHATIIELWWRWGRLAAFRRSRRSRASLNLAQRALAPASEYSILAGRAHYRHALRLPLDEHAVIFSPPRGGKTGWLARAILHYPTMRPRAKPRGACPAGHWLRSYRIGTTHTRAQARSWPGPT